MWKTCILKQERESVIMLCMPGMCCAEIWLAANKNRLRRRTMMWGQWEVPELRQ